MSSLTVEWIDHHREPKCAPNPAYPLGIDIDLAPADALACKASLPYPARRCGVYVVRCGACGMSAGVTTAGRVDDPRSLRIPCNLKGAA